MPSKKRKPRILIADDSDMNRYILLDMLEADYEILEAEDGEEALDIIDDYGGEIDLLLLDYRMPGLNGLEVLKELGRRSWKRSIPVIMISAENDRTFIVQSYRLGAMDYINRPFDATIVRHRVDSIMRLHGQEKQIAQDASEKLSQKFRNDGMIINILTSLLEFRSGKYSNHTLNVQVLTDMFLRELMNVSDAYHFTGEDILLISKASALHDIGMCKVPLEIIEKPADLTPEEEAIVRKHPLWGCEMLETFAEYMASPLMDKCLSIVRWHHERYDGKGYPDGLKEDGIPIEAQVVGLADCYETLTNVRPYKRAYSHVKAVDMILSGDCGAFNPLLLECLENLSPTMPERLSGESFDKLYQDQIQKVMEEVIRPKGSAGEVL
ncbi:MAG: response regulator [Lachnospiraceae bacterium]|nr:response regulator [Lachnospiraceae bacterium]